MTFGSGCVLFDGNSKKLAWQSGGLIYAEVILPLKARVLDVGSGQDPHPGADLYVDKFMDDDRHRLGNYGIVRKLRFQVVNPDQSSHLDERDISVQEADIANLPFADKEFDFVIARHILEHVDDLRKALNELGRVAKAGYIEVPKMTSEMLFPQGEIHRWTFDDINGKLTAKSVVGFQSPFGGIMHTLFAERQDLREAWSKAYLHFHAVKIWNDFPECEIIE